MNTATTLLIVGSGGREHALAWALAQSPGVARMFVAPGNAGTLAAPGSRPGAPSVANVDIPVEDIPALARFAVDHGVDLAVIGPEAPLAAGIVDAFQAAGLRVFGPARAAAQLESSKSFAKDFMRACGIPTAGYAVFAAFDQACAYVRASSAGPRGLVVKADGLAAGKGVVVCDTADQALAALHRIMVDREFGAAGDTVVIEERLSGPELSVLAFSDGRAVLPMPPARDHKRVFDGDHGPNTGGMGAYAPAPGIGDDSLEAIRRSVLQPVIDGMAARGTPYAGVLYAGLMLTQDGPKVLEFNCRFGDPETQAILPLLDQRAAADDAPAGLLEIIQACVDGRLAEVAPRVRWRAGACATVVLASPGYPGRYPRGLPITGLDQAARREDVAVFHAGTALAEGQVVTAGGRVLAVSAVGADLPSALARAYATIGDIRFDAMHYRRDIGLSDVSSSHAGGSRYAAAGVNIAAGARAVDLMSAAVRSTYGPQVLAGIGAFGGLFAAAALKAMRDPVLVASTDGVGTKTKVAARLNRWDTIGQDIVNHGINDILVQGAQPLFFLDYVASSKLDAGQVATIVSGAAKACREAGCALLGGETAEMPGVYQPGEVDLVGTIVGVVDRSAVVDGRRIRPGDAILGLPSTGLHTNGYSLARRVLDGLDWQAPVEELGCAIGEALLAVHRSYLAPVQALLRAGVDVRGLAHITGGGFIDNLPRILPPGVSALIRRGAWPELPIFGLIQRLGGIPGPEMFHVFNMGLGMLVVAPRADVDLARATLSGDAWLAGEIVAGSGAVQILGG